MSAYALAHLRETDRQPEILEYMDRIQVTLDPFFGRFLVHGGDIDVHRATYHLLSERLRTPPPL